MKDVELQLLLSGLKTNMSPTDNLPIEQVGLRRFDGGKWAGFGDFLGR